MHKHICKGRACCEMFFWNDGDQSFWDSSYNQRLRTLTSSLSACQPETLLTRTYEWNYYVTCRLLLTTTWKNRVWFRKRAVTVGSISFTLFGKIDIALVIIFSWLRIRKSLNFVRTFLRICQGQLRQSGFLTKTFTFSSELKTNEVLRRGYIRWCPVLTWKIKLYHNSLKTPVVIVSSKMTFGVALRYRHDVVYQLGLSKGPDSQVRLKYLKLAVKALRR